MAQKHVFKDLLKIFRGTGGASTGVTLAELNIVIYNIVKSVSCQSFFCYDNTKTKNLKDMFVLHRPQICSM